LTKTQTAIAYVLFLLAQNTQAIFVSKAQFYTFKTDIISYLLPGSCSGAFSSRKVSLLDDTNVKVKNCELLSQFRFRLRAQENSENLRIRHIPALKIKTKPMKNKNKTNKNKN